MASILIAPLGESPIVVTAMVEALQHHPDGPQASIDIVEVLYPSGHDSQLIDLGFECIRSTLEGHSEVRGHCLSFPDANTEASCIEYLRTVDGVLEAHQQDDVYVSIAGGRKSMSALTAVVTQFHRQVKGLYHLLDRREAEPARRNYKSIDELFDMTDAERHKAMRPRWEDLKLVSLPHRHLADADQLRRYYKALGQAESNFGAGEEEAPVEIDDDGAAFLAGIFGAQAPSERLELRLSTVAYEQFSDYSRRAANFADEFRSSFRQMLHPGVLKKCKHGGPFGAQGRVCFFFKRRRTRARPFFYTEPSPIDFYPDPARPVKRVVIAGLSLEQPDGTYKPSAEEWLARAPYDATYTWEQLPPRPGVLLVSLGESPMVATQTYTLLREREGIRIERVVLLFPGADPPIRNGARFVKDLFERSSLDRIRGSAPVPVEVVPIEGLEDVDSDTAVAKFGAALGAEIARLRDRYPDHPLHLSLSGGRKAMAALTYYGAQQAGIAHVWHTTVADPDLDRQVDSETTLEVLQPLSAEEKARRLFLHAYDRSKFTIFCVPVVPLTWTRSGGS